jgi:polar amino acid transport system permease protein
MVWEDIVDYTPILLRGAVVTIEISVLALLISTPLGFVWALIKMSKCAVARHTVTILINVVRGIPMIVVLFYIYFVFPDVGIRLSSFQASVIGLAFAYSMYMAEIFRGGIEAMDPGQMEAARSLGMGRWKAMRRAVLPQAFRTALPSYSNALITLLKDSALASTIAVAEMTREGQLIAASTFQNMTIYTMVALLYLAMSLPLMKVTRILEQRFGKHDVR